jgi:hypothetical protein
MLTLQTNRANIFGRILAILIVVGLEYLIIEKGIPGAQSKNEKGVVILYFLIPLFAYVFLAIIGTFFQVVKVQVNMLSGEVTLSKFFSQLTIQKQDIAGYYTTIYKGSRAKPWCGLLLKTVDNKSFRLTEQNLKSIQELKNYFVQENFKYFGEKRAFFSQ